jgi:hypothetical protein
MGKDGKHVILIPSATIRVSKNAGYKRTRQGDEKTLEY